MTLLFSYLCYLLDTHLCERVRMYIFMYIPTCLSMLYITNFISFPDMKVTKASSPVTKASSPVKGHSMGANGKIRVSIKSSLHAPSTYVGNYIQLKCVVILSANQGRTSPYRDVSFSFTWCNLLIPYGVEDKVCMSWIFASEYYLTRVSH